MYSAVPRTSPVRVSASGLGDGARDPEVGELGAPHPSVGRGVVPVSRRTFCGFRSRWTRPAAWTASSALGDLDRDADRVAPGQAPGPVEALGERAARDQLERDVEPPVALARAEATGNPGVGDHHSPRPASRRKRIGELVGHVLSGAITLSATSAPDSVARAIDRPHGPAAEETLDLELAEGASTLELVTGREHDPRV